MLKEFRDFIMRGNVIDLAVGIVIGAAFGSVVTSFTYSTSHRKYFWKPGPRPERGSSARPSSGWSGPTTAPRAIAARSPR